MPPEDDDLPPFTAQDAQGLPFLDAAAKPEKAVSPHAGHRERLRARFLKAGGESLADHEMIELLLFGALPRIDTKPLAKALIERFGSYEEALAAPAERLRG